MVARVCTLVAILCCSATPAWALLGSILGGDTGASCTAATCGTFAAPFVEPTIAGQATAEKCLTDGNGELACKPAAGTLAMLADGRVLYWDALEGTERVQFSVIIEFGDEAANDQTRI